MQLLGTRSVHVNNSNRSLLQDISSFKLDQSNRQKSPSAKYLKKFEKDAMDEKENGSLK